MKKMVNGMDKREKERENGRNERKKEWMESNKPEITELLMLASEQQ